MSVILNCTLPRNQKMDGVCPNPYFKAFCKYVY